MNIKAEIKRVIDNELPVIAISVSHYRRSLFLKSDTETDFR